jgi:hypothetical protein
VHARRGRAQLTSTSILVLTRRIFFVCQKIYLSAKLATTTRNETQAQVILSKFSSIPKSYTTRLVYWRRWFMGPCSSLPLVTSLVE